MSSLVGFARALCFSLIFVTWLPHYAIAKCLVVPVVAIEGSGHHGYNLILGQISKQMDEAGTHIGHKFPGTPKIAHVLNQNNYERATEMYESWSRNCNKGENRTCITYGGCSFPCSRSPWVFRLKQEKRWKPKNWNWLMKNGHPMHITKFYDMVKPFCDVKFLLVHRNLVDVSWTHKTWDGGLKNHAEVMIFFAKYIDVSFSKLPSDVWTRFNYEDIWTEDRDKVFAALAEWLGADMTKTDVADAFEKSGFKLSSSTPPPDCQSIDMVNKLQQEQMDTLEHYSNPYKHILGPKIASNFWLHSPKAKMAKGCKPPSDLPTLEGIAPAPPPPEGAEVETVEFPEGEADINVVIEHDTPQQDQDQPGSFLSKWFGAPKKAGVTPQLDKPDDPVPIPEAEP
mmetsp:Transcript_38526/g.46560  ORF Transcript_38526/g.46560 Transcript_38526/m.46560 type:complete len:397 (+) Transcript_38526:411-1601(+)|eukprot:CAMPEP_0197849084 /NCGR_PEP_ID=MMETSP1438-20131217/10847_1 /TAXON_ID=1461541 /ORGANISM="Pterosperma sp., Strain CCMP1384" /LENGTH=396 /DNA_ID=CAMNT_0043461611 /DNA_START=411 /DNA_END=1601 /DNA_ORIENTATION=+